MTVIAAETPGLDRKHGLSALRSRPDIDVLILGGGVNGAGTFRELSLQGLRCALVERHDFASGASGASTRIAMGGFRYLEQGRLELVQKLSVERNRLVKNAAHLIEPLQVAIPVESIWGGVLTYALRFAGAPRKGRLPGLAVLRLGLAMYDYLGRKDRSLPLAASLHGAALRKTNPDFSETIRGLGWAWEGQIRHPERIVFELLEDAVAANPAGSVLNHCAALSGSDSGVLLQDCLSGETFFLRPRAAVNATGAWANRTNELFGIYQPLVRGSKGSHLLLDNPQLRDALGGKLIYFGDGGSRMCVAYRFGGYVLLGATDIPVQDPDEAICEDAEVAYLLQTVSQLYPDISVSPEQVRFRWCGVRPLADFAGERIGDVSRDFQVVTLSAPHLPFPLVTLAGGKWTTFRAAAEQIADTVLGLLNKPRLIDTAHLEIGGAKGYPRTPEGQTAWIASEARRYGLPTRRVEHLLRRYGTRALAVAEYCSKGTDKPLPHAEHYTEREIQFLIDREMACTLEDIVARRSTLALEGGVPEALACRLSGLLAAQGLDPDRPGLNKFLEHHDVRTC
jgi:glycerol-3-phosphate dehydrogenase